jgi:hypothetical protein
MIPSMIGTAKCELCEDEEDRLLVCVGGPVLVMVLGSPSAGNVVVVDRPVDVEVHGCSVIKPLVPAAEQYSDMEVPGKVVLTIELPEPAVSTSAARPRTLIAQSRATSPNVGFVDSMMTRGIGSPSLKALEGTFSSI